MISAQEMCARAYIQHKESRAMEAHRMRAAMISRTAQTVISRFPLRSVSVIKNRRDQR